MYFKLVKEVFEKKAKIPVNVDQREEEAKKLPHW